MLQFGYQWVGIMLLMDFCNITRGVLVAEKCSILPISHIWPNIRIFKIPSWLGWRLFCVQILSVFMFSNIVHRQLFWLYCRWASYLPFFLQYMISMNKWFYKRISVIKSCVEIKAILIISSKKSSICNFIIAVI